MKRVWRLTIGVLCLVLAIVLIAVFGDGVQNFSAKYEGYDLLADVTGLGRSNTYDGYLQAHASAAAGKGEVPVDIAVFEGDGEIRMVDGSACVYTRYPRLSAADVSLLLHAAAPYDSPCDPQRFCSCRRMKPASSLFDSF